MLRYYKRQICSLKTQLNALDPTSENHKPLLDFQDEVIRRILSTEKKLKQQKLQRIELKGELRKRIPKAESLSLKQQIRRCEERIVGYRFLLYVWKSFGDAIAFKYVSKWNLKRLLYSHDSVETKPDAGGLSGKSGFDAEYSLLQSAISHGVPSSPLRHY